MRLTMLRWLATVALLFGAAQAQAACTALLGCSCNASIATLSFGTVNPLSGTASTTAGTVQVSCGGLASIAVPIKVDFSTGGSNSYVTRKLTNIANSAYTLNYNLFIDNTYQTVWGNGTGGTQSVNGNIALDLLGLAPPLSMTIYGRIPSGQNTTPPGTYTDTITVTVTYQ